MTTWDANATGAGGNDQPETVKVWDPLVRVFHWSLVACFAFAWITAEEWDDAHEAVGYVIAGLVAFRVIWGVIGPRRARFADFLYRPATVIRFLKDSVAMRAKRYLGHNPAGGAMVIALLVTLATIIGTGLMLEDGDRHGLVKDLHELAANFSLILVGLHVLGVALASVEHGENLVRAMVTGRKRPLEADHAARPGAD